MAFRRRIRLWWNKHPYVLAVAGGVGVFLSVLYVLYRPQQPLSESFLYSRLIYDRDGELLRITLAPDDRYRVFTHANSAGTLLKKALLLKEDRFFHYHPGFNPVSLVRAAWRTYVIGDRKIGGSTITMQTARLHYRLNTRSLPGKIKQILLSVYLELYYTKNEILQAYLNLAPCGGNIEGFAAGALIYFGSNLADLTLDEALFLAVLPQNPSAFRPRTGCIAPELTDSRRQLLAAWRDTYPGDVPYEPHPDLPLSIGYRVPFSAPHFTDKVLAQHPGVRKLHTTLSLKKQCAITRLTDRYIQRNSGRGVHNAAVLLVDADNMHVLASLGSADYFNAGISGQVDGTRARRSPGSTLKPFIYGLAIDQGLLHPMTMLKDAPISFSEYAPDNYEKDFKGPITAWEALVTSRNVPAVQLASRLSGPDLYGFLDRTGTGALKGREHYGLSIVLGSAEFSMEELAALYGILANDGEYRELVSVRNAATEPALSGLLSREACYLVRDMLTRNQRPATVPVPVDRNRRRPVAYKTGTSIGFKDCWSIALFDHYILAVWLGNFNGYGNQVFNGRHLAAPLLFEIIDAIAPDENRADPRWFAPDGVVETEVCTVSGRLPGPHCGRKCMTQYIPGTSSIQTCRICREIFVDVKTGYRTLKPVTGTRRQVVEFWSTDILELFNKAGIPRRTPPAFSPRQRMHLVSQEGTAPTIVSPLNKTRYIVRQGDREFNNLPLRAVVDADVREVYWFIDERFIGKSDPAETQYWSLTPGSFNISVSDDHGRSDVRAICIEMASN